MFKAPFPHNLVASGSNAKTIKGDKELVYETAIMYLAPHTLAATILPDSKILFHTVCPLALMAMCHAPCLNIAGRGRFTSTQIARAKKTERYFADRAQFMADFVATLEKFVRHCAKHDVLPACRANGTSDIQYEIGHPVTRKGVAYASIFEAFPEIQFYDYTKIAKRVSRKLPANYHLTLSWSGANAAYADMIQKAHNATGANVAVVFRTKAIRDAYMLTGWNGATVIDGDKTDMRFLDPTNVIVGLYAKGPKAKADYSGFVLD